MERRSFLKSLGLISTAALAPGIVQASNLMKINPRIGAYTLYGNGFHDDTIAFQAFVDGKSNIFYPDGRKVGDKLKCLDLTLSSTIMVGNNNTVNRLVTNCVLNWRAAKGEKLFEDIGLYYSPKANFFLISNAIYTPNQIA